MTPPPDRRLFFLLSAASRRVQRWAEARLAAAGGLTTAQAGVLFFLGGRDGALIGEVAQALDAAPSAMTGLVDRMVRAGLVERRPDTRDRRAQRVHLTPAGRQARAAALGGLAQANAELSKGFTEAEMTVVARWLSSLQHHLSEEDPK